MKEINFCRGIENMDGTVATTPLQHIVGNVIAGMKAKEDACQQMLLAQKIYKSKGNIYLEDAEINLVKKILQGANIPAMTQAVAEKAIEEAVKVDIDSKQKAKNG